MCLLPGSARAPVHYEEGAWGSRSPSSLPTPRCDITPRPTQQTLQGSVGDTGQKTGVGAWLCRKAVSSSSEEMSYPMSLSWPFPMAMGRRSHFKTQGRCIPLTDLD